MTPLEKIAQIQQLGGVPIFDRTWSDDEEDDRFWRGYRLDGRFILVVEFARARGDWTPYDAEPYACHFYEFQHPRELADFRDLDIPDDIQHLAVSRWHAPSLAVVVYGPAPEYRFVYPEGDPSLGVVVYGPDAWSGVPPPHSWFLDWYRSQPHPEPQHSWFLDLYQGIISAGDADEGAIG
ncbi:MAG TPA: hypothetical protein VH157_07065 [Bryobacteraceae bacterium]|jgi:hypothetical protein|nr:hypothetical protein [Bryobacteraceae bacterium]